MVKIGFCAVVGVMMTSMVMAGSTDWVNVNKVNVGASQASFSNWAAGGTNNWAAQLDWVSTWEQDAEAHNWLNTFKLSYGLAQVGNAEVQKANDLIRGETLYVFKTAENWKPFLAATAQTQITKGYDYSTTPKTEISNFFDPAYFTQSAGWVYRASKELSIRLGVGLKETVANRFTNFSNGKTFLFEAGFESVADYKTKWSEHSSFHSILRLFFPIGSTYEASWDNTLESKIAGNLATVMNLSFLYDQKQSSRLQYKSAMTLGLAYVF